MKQYLRHSILALTVLPLIGFLLHFNNTSSVAHANLHVADPITPLARLADSLRTMSIELDQRIAMLSAEQLTLRNDLCLPVESCALDDLIRSESSSIMASLPSIDPDAFQLTTRIEKQLSYIRMLDEQVERHREMAASVPVLTPVNGVHTSGFGMRVHPIRGVEKQHAGMDIAARSGTPIHASGAGVVLFSGVQSGYGNVVIVDHGSGYRTLYAHCSKLLVKAGEQVTRGQNIALVGSTGASTGSHLHYEVMVDGTKIDPSPFLMQSLSGPEPAIAQASAHAGHVKALKLLATH
jgi:Peptidase family M23